MKKTFQTFIIAVLPLLAFDAHAQIEKGKWISTIGLYIDVNDGKGASAFENEKTLGFSGSIQQGYFIKKNFAVGVGYTYLQNKRSSSSTDGSYVKDKSYSNEIFVYAQYYKIISGRIYYSPLILIDYLNQKGRYRTKAPGFTETISTYNFDNYGLQINPAQFSLSLSKKIVLEAGLCSIIVGKRDGQNVYPTYTETGKSTSLKINFSPFITNVKISLLF